MSSNYWTVLLSGHYDTSKQSGNIVFLDVRTAAAAIPAVSDGRKTRHDVIAAHSVTVL